LRYAGGLTDAERSAIPKDRTTLKSLTSFSARL
jgi:hypothetical protein